ncbi:hypothetical protein Mpsy_2268 [Methanolobus psychrophilus R15]|nr:hypothetical protein Mpsy_2268 [Methanolobus psychrophilus R15]
MTIHIVPIGLDSPDRFIEGFRKFAPSKVIFLMGTEDSDIEREAIKIKETVEENVGKHVAVSEHKAELFKFADAMKTFAKIITALRCESEDELIYINISSSTKVIIQAAYMAASLFSARIYYVPAEKYMSTEILPLLNLDDLDQKKEQIYKFVEENRYLSIGVKEAYEIPVLKMQPPSKIELDVLETINTADDGKYKSLKSLVEDGLALEYNGSNRNKYSQIVTKLERDGFVSTNRSGRKKDIHLTDSGKVIAEISEILLSSF